MVTLWQKLESGFSALREFASKSTTLMIYHFQAHPTQANAGKLSTPHCPFHMAGIWIQIRIQVSPNYSLATCLTFLGVGFIILEITVPVPVCRSDYQCLMTIVKSRLDSLAWAKCIRDVHQLQSLIGCLVPECHVLSLGKAFLNHLFHQLAVCAQATFGILIVWSGQSLINWWQIMRDGRSGISIHQFWLQQHAASSSPAYRCIRFLSMMATAWEYWEWPKIKWCRKRFATNPAWLVSFTSGGG